MNVILGVFDGLRLLFFVGGIGIFSKDFKNSSGDFGGARIRYP